MLSNVDHCLLNAIFMPYVLKANESVIEDKIIRLSRYQDLDDKSFYVFLCWILDVRASLDLAHALSALEANADQAELIGAMLAADSSAGGNPGAFTADEYRRLFLTAFEGEKLLD